jgi:hypothetical protein
MPTGGPLPNGVISDLPLKCRRTAMGRHSPVVKSPSSNMRRIGAIDDGKPGSRRHRRADAGGDPNTGTRRRARYPLDGHALWASVTLDEYRRWELSCYLQLTEKMTILAEHLTK